MSKQLKLTRDYDSIMYFQSDADGTYYTIKPIIYSSKLENEFIGSMYAKNLNFDKTVTAQMCYGMLDQEFIGILGHLSFMQDDFDPDRFGVLDLFEFKSTLGNVEVAAIDVPEEVQSIYFGYQSDFDKIVSGEAYLDDIEFDQWDCGSDWNYLLLLGKSSEPIGRLSQEIHDVMEFPHNEMMDIVVTFHEISNNSFILVLDKNRLKHKPSGMQLNDLLIEDRSFGDTKYLKVIEDKIEDKLFLTINENTRPI